LSLITEKTSYLNGDAEYCEIIINHGVLIFSDFEVHLQHENKNPAKYNVACSV
jgi:hypothetical protein